MISCSPLPIGGGAGGEGFALDAARLRICVTCGDKNTNRGGLDLGAPHPNPLPRREREPDTSPLSLPGRGAGGGGVCSRRSAVENLRDLLG